MTTDQNPEQSTAIEPGTYSAEEIEQMIREDDIDPDTVIEIKIQEAITKAIEAGEIDPDLPVVVGIDPTSGRIAVGNGEPDPDDTMFGTADEADNGERLAEFKLPDSFFQHSESLADNPRQLEHFEKHWGF